MARRAMAHVTASITLISLAGCGIDLSAFNQQGGQQPAAPNTATPAQPAITPTPPAVPAANPLGISGAAAPAGATTPAPAAVNDGNGDLYGHQGTEPILPVGQAPANAPLRARKDDTLFEISKAKLGTGRFGRPTLSLFYEIKHRGSFGGATLIIHTPDGEEETVSLLGGFWDDQGEIEVEIPFSGPFTESSFPEHMELFLVRSEWRYGPLLKGRFKISNSITVGTMPSLTYARNWTPEEAATLRQPFPDYTNPGAHPDVGHDTPFAGDTTGGGPQRYVSPQKPLLGLEYRLGEWDGEKCVGGLVCVFDRNQPVTHEPRIIAREGYAVGAVNVHSLRFVDAVQVVFMKLTGDGRLDAAESYTSDWIGYPGNGAPERVGGDGRQVIGVVCQQGAILNGLALVMDKPAP